MAESDSSTPKNPLLLNAYDIKRICVVHWDTEPLAAGQKSSSVHVMPLREDERLPKNEPILKIDGEWFRQLSKDSTETFKPGDQINIIFGHKDGDIKWLERRDDSQASSTLNKIFT